MNDGTVTTDQVLSERGQVYGKFAGHADISQRIKLAMWECENWTNLSASQREAMEMIAHKLARVLNGNPNYVDNWTDIAGYARLVELELAGVGK